MKKIIFSSFAALSFFSFLHADAIANDCTQISNDKKRLACYDSIFMEKPKEREVEKITQIGKPPTKILKKDSPPNVHDGHVCRRRLRAEKAPRSVLASAPTDAPCHR